MGWERAFMLQDQSVPFLAYSSSSYFSSSLRKEFLLRRRTVKWLSPLHSSSSSSQQHHRTVVEAEQLGTKKTAAAPSNYKRTELFNALEVYFPHFQSFLTFPGPQPDDRAQVSAEDVRLPNSLSTALSTQDTQIVLKLSDDFNLNELYCASLFDSARQEWNLQGRGPLEILRLSAGLWFTERRALISSLELLIQAVMDDEWDPDLAVEIHLYIERLLNAGLRTRLITLIKELNEEGPSGLGGHGVEPYVVDSSGAIVLRCNVVHKERLSLSHCLLLMCSAFRINAEEAKDLYNLLRDCSTEESLLDDDVKFQITYTIMCLLSNSLVSNVLGQPQDWLALDAGFRRDFQLLVMDAADLGPIAVGFTAVIQFVWAVYLMLTEDGTEGTSTGSSFLDDESSSLCLDRACEQDVFKFLNARVLQSATFQKDDYITLSKYNAYVCKLLARFFSIGREKIMELKRATLDTVGKHMIHGKETIAVGDGRAQQQAMDIQPKPFISLLNLVGEIYQRQPNLILDNEDLWNFVQFAGEDQTSHWTLVAFLNMLTALAVCEEGARKVYHLLQKKSIRTLGWQTLFNSLVVYDQRFRQFLQIPGAVLPVFQERDGRALEAYLAVLRRVMMTGNEMERTEWFTDIEPLFKLLPYENVPPYLKGALRSAITNFVYVSPEMKNKVWCLLEQYDLPVPPTPPATNGSLMQASSQAYDISFELNEVEARVEEYPSTLSYLKLHNVFIANETDTSDKGVRHMGLFRFVRDQLFAKQSQRAFANLVEKWELAAAALHHFELMLSVYKLTDEEIKNSTIDILPSEKSLLGMIAPYSATGVTTQIPGMEVMKDLMNGKVIYHNLMSILMLGVNSVMEQRTGQLHGSVLEEAICLSFKILILAFSKDTLYAEAWSPVYQPIHIVLSRDSQLIVTLLEYVRYDKLPLIQQYSIQIMNLLSARMPKLVSVILEAGAAPKFIEDYATCLQAHTVETEVLENPVGDIGALILRLLLANLGQPSPNVTHLLLSFDLNQPIEKTRLRPDHHFSCLWVILDFLDTPTRPGLNTGLQGLGYQLIHELCVDPVTCGPMLELLGGEKFDTNLKRTLGIGNCMFMDKGKSPVFPEVALSPEVYDLELQTCHPGEAEAAELPNASNSREVLGFLNPTPLATRCTTKQNDRTTGRSMGALRSSWIQRLFLGILGEGTMPSHCKEKEKQPGPPQEEGVHLLLKDKRSSEDPGHQVQASFEGQSGQDSCDIDKRPRVMQEISVEDCVLEHNYGSQIPSTSIARKGPLCAFEGRGIQPGGERELTAKVYYAVEGVALTAHAEDNVEGFVDLKLEGDHEGNSALLSEEQSLNASKGVEHSLTGIPPLVPPRFKDQPKNGEKLQGNIHPSTLWNQNTGVQRLEMQGISELPSGQSWLPAPQSIPNMMVWEPNECPSMIKVSRRAGQGENTAAAGTSEPSMPGEVNRSPPCDLQPLVKDNVHSRDQKHEGNKMLQISSALSHRSPLQHPIESATEDSSLIKNHRPGLRETIRRKQQPVLGAFGPGSGSVATDQRPLALPGARISPEVDYPGSGDGQRSGGQEEELNKHVDLQKNSGFQVHCSDKKVIDNGLLSSSSLPPLSLFAPFKHNKEQRRLACGGKTKVDPPVSGESLLTPLFPSHGYVENNDEEVDGSIPKGKFDATIFAPYKPSPDPVSSSSRSDTLKLLDAAKSMSRSSFMAPTCAPLITAKEQHEPSASPSKPQSVAADLMDVDDRNAIDTRREHLGTKTFFGFEVNTHLVSDQQGSTSNHIIANKHISSVHSSSLVPERVTQTAVPLQIPVPGFYGGGYQQAETPCKTINTSAIELSSRRPSLHEEAGDIELEQEPSSKNHNSTKPSKVDRTLQEQHLKVQECPPQNSRLYAPSFCEASSASSTPMASGHVPHGHQLISLPPSSSGQNHVSVIARTSMFPGKQQIMRSSAQGRFKNCAPSSSRVKGGKETATEDPDCKEREREIVASTQEPVRGDGGHDHMEHRSGALPGEGTAEILGRGMNQGEIRCDTCQMWTDAPGDRPGRSSRKRSHDAGTRIYGTHAQNPENSCVDPNYVSKRDTSQAPPQTQAWLQRWMSSPRPKALPTSTHNVFAGRFSSEQAPTHAKNRKLGQDSTVQGEFFNHTGPAFRAQCRPQDLEIGDSSLGASYRGNFQDSSLFCPGFYSLPSAAALALVGAASRKTVPLPPQRIGTRVAVWPAIAGGGQVEGNESGFQGGILLQPEVRVIVEEGQPTNCT